MNSPVSAMISPPGLSASTFTFSAAGFIATSTSGASPAVSISVEPKLIWKAETPNNVPCGARISAGKSGKVAKIVARQRARQGELPAGELHAVAGVAREAHHHRLGGGRRYGRFFGCESCHLNNPYRAKGAHNSNLAAHL